MNTKETQQCGNYPLELQRSAEHAIVEAELTRERFLQLQLKEGAHVHLRPRHVRVFLKQ